MRNRNNDYYTPDLFDELLANKEMDKLKEHLLTLLKVPSSMKGLYLIKKYIFAFSDADINACKPFACIAAICASVEGHKEAADRYLSMIKDLPVLERHALLYMPCTPDEKFKELISSDSYDMPLNLPLDGARPSIINGFRDFSRFGRYLPDLKDSLTASLYKLYGNDSTGMYETALAEYYYQNNQCFEALCTIVAVLPLIQEKGSVCILLAAMFVQLHVLAATGQTSSLRLLINNCEKTMSQTDYSLNKDCLDALRAWCALYDGDWSLTDSWLSYQEENYELPSLISLEQEFVKIRIYIHLEQYYKAIVCVKPMFNLLDYANRYMDMCEAKLLYSMALFSLGEKEKAYDTLEQVLPVIKQYHYYRLVADEGEYMYRLLRSYCSDLNINDNELNRLIELSKEMGMLYPDYLRRRPDKFPELTHTEKQVLYLMSDERTNVEIADYLNISVNTVKFHCKNIYEKLDVPNRRQAIKTARELHILRN